MLLGKKPPEKNSDAVSAAGIGAYTVDVPICVLKSITGEVIKREGENEAKSIGQKSRIVKP